MAILDDARSFPSLWSTTIEFISTYAHLVHPSAELDWLLSPTTGDYNNCQFFSNFEIGSLNFFRSAGPEAYFQHLDMYGGFYYERYGDAPIHTLAMALFAKKSEVWFFRDVGYQHDSARHCPRRQECSCEPTDLDENFYKLVPMESPQNKPEDTCIRLWLGGEWMEKKQGWDQEAERMMGGDGYGGYVLSE